MMDNIDFPDIISKQDIIRNTHVNIGSGEDIRIKDLAYLLKNIIGFKGKIIWDSTKPDGTLRKLLDISKISDFDWKKSTGLKIGLEMNYKHFLG